MQKKLSKFILLAFGIIVFLNLIFDLLLSYLNELFSPGFGIRFLLAIIASILLAAILTTALSILSPFWLESIITLKRMMRTESLSNPLLIKLSSEAPGTYHHSLNVSTLASKAAKTINADSLLVRTAAYYHDIGKLVKPYTFVENQSGKEIPTLADADSIKKNAQKIIAHVENGIRIARENNLPEDVIDLIKEHHGNTKALYFYQQAKEHGLKIKKTDFRYQGPVPQTKESAILMLADCIEATARALPNITSDQLCELVDKSIRERWNEKQIKAANLSEKEIEAIGTSLKETLNAIYHQRMVYKDGQFNNR